MIIRRMFTSSLLVAWLTAVVGCANITVETAILDKSFWTSPSWLDEQLRQRILKADASLVNGQFAEARRADIQEIQEIFKRLEDKHFIEDGSAGALAAQFSTEIIKAYEVAGEEFAQAASDLRARPGDGSASLKTAEEHYKQGNKALDDLRVMIRIGLRDTSSRDPSPAPGQPAPTTQAVAQIKAEVAQDVDQTVGRIVKRQLKLIGEYGLLDDPYASAVIYAPEAYWEGSFNKTFAHGGFGDIDVALKMEDVGQFTVKGVRNDTARVTQATFAVVQQSVQTVAALYGIPVPRPSSPATPTEAQPFAVNTPAVDSPGVRLRTIRTEQQRLRQMRFQLADTILLNVDNTTDDARRAAAVKQMAEVISAQLAELSPPKTSTPSE